MKVLITGTNGLLGQHLAPLLLKKGYEVVATGKGEPRFALEAGAPIRYHSIDITDPMNVYHLMELEKPEVVVHAAAMTQVDDCEKDPEHCEQTNVQATTQLLVDAETFSRHFIYLSTDFVFDGERGNYGEEDELSPVNFYGFTKLQAEGVVQTSEIPWAIVRTSLVYGNVSHARRSNIIGWIRESLEKRQPIKVVSDQRRTPTFVEDLAQGIILIIEKKATGIYHIAGKDELSPYEMAIQTAELLQLDHSNIEKVDASSFSQPGKRPPRTSLLIGKARKELGYEPLSFREGLRKVLGKT